MSRSRNKLVALVDRDNPWAQVFVIPIHPPQRRPYTHGGTLYRTRRPRLPSRDDTERSRPPFTGRELAMSLFIFYSLLAHSSSFAPKDTGGIGLVARRESGFSFSLLH